MKRSTHRRTSPSYPDRSDIVSRGGTEWQGWSGPQAPQSLAGAWLASGTRLATVRGELPVEVLGAGDVLIVGGVFRATVHDVEHRVVQCVGLARPWDAWPVHVRAGALGANLPHRDLVLSPGHRVFVDGVLIPIHCLIDGHAIVQPRAAAGDYWRILLDTPDVILAEGLPVEGAAFHTGFDEDAPLGTEDAAAARSVETGLLVEAVRARITRRRAA